MRTATLSEALTNCEVVHFDLDGIFYPITPYILDTYAIGVAKAAMDLIPGLSLEEGVKIAWESWHKHHYSLQTFVERYGVDLNEMHQLYHRYCDTSILPIDEAVPELFKTFPLHPVIQTHGSHEWACRVLAHEKVRSYFPDRHIYGLEHWGFHRKSESTLSFEHVLREEGFAAHQAIMLDDSDANLFMAKRLGMTTVLDTNGREVAPLPHVDFTVTSLREFLHVASGLARQPDAGFRTGYARKIGPANLSR